MSQHKNVKKGLVIARAITMTLLVAYVLACEILSIEFNVFVCLGVSNLILFTGLFAAAHKKVFVECPVDYMVFTDDSLRVGDYEYVKNDIKKVNLDEVEGIVYFLLPYNTPKRYNKSRLHKPSRPSGGALFTFPVGELSCVVKHLEDHLPNAEVLVWSNDESVRSAQAI